MDVNQKISLALLAGRLVTVFIMAMVIRKQHRVLRANNYPELRPLRIRLLIGSYIAMAGNIIPVMIDTMGLFGKGSFALLLAYVFSNNFTAILTAYLVWFNIRLSEKIKLH